MSDFTITARDADVAVGNPNCDVIVGSTSLMCSPAVYVDYLEINIVENSVTFCEVSLVGYQGNITIHVIRNRLNVTDGWKILSFFEQ